MRIGETKMGSPMVLQRAHRYTSLRTNAREREALMTMPGTRTSLFT